MLALLGSLLAAPSGVAQALMANGPIAYAGFGGGFDLELFRVDPATGSSTQLTDNTFTDTDPSWSPDGSKLAFASDRGGEMDIYVLEVATGSIANVTGPGDGWDQQPDWSPDGTRLVLVRDGVIQVVDSGHPGRPTALAPGLWPSWSPDGGSIAFSRDGDLYTISPEGGEPARLTTGALADRPDWSPNGDLLAFEATGLDPDGVSHIYTMPSTGGSPTQLTSHDFVEDFDPSWSPDGTRLAFTRIGVDAEIFVMDASGTNKAALTSNDEYDVEPSWGPCTGPACPTPGVTPTRAPSTTRVGVAKGRLRVTVFGDVTPAHAGMHVTVVLAKRRNGAWRRVARKTPILRADGSYATRFTRRNPGRCRVRAAFPGDADHLPSRATKRFRC